MSTFGSLFATPAMPPAGQGDPRNVPLVSGFLTAASFANFTAMTGAISTAWGGLRQVDAFFDTKYVPFALCLLFALVSLVASKPGTSLTAWLSGLFVGGLNALTLFSAVVGATQVVATAA